MSPAAAALLLLLLIYGCAESAGSAAADGSAETAAARNMTARDAGMQEVGAEDGAAQNGAALRVPAPADPVGPSSGALSEEAERAVDLTGVLAQGGFARGEVRGDDVEAVTLGGEEVPLLPDGRFFIAFGRDASEEVVLRVRFRDGGSLTRTLVIADTQFQESRLPARTTEAIEASPGFRVRRAREVARIASARAQPSQLTGWTERFVAPVDADVTSPFGAQRFYGDVPRSPHSGTDFGAAAGTPVVAPASSRVALAGPGYSYEGKLVILDHGLGLYSAFLHLEDIDVELGQDISRGERLGTVGSSGRATGPHLHWGLWWNGVRFDPQALTGRGGER